MRPSLINVMITGVVYTTAGNHDVLALVRATDVDHLRRVIDRLRTTRQVISTRTHVVLASHVKAGWSPQWAR